VGSVVCSTCAAAYTLLGSECLTCDTGFFRSGTGLKNTSLIFAKKSFQRLTVRPALRVLITQKKSSPAHQSKIALVNATVALRQQQVYYKRIQSTIMSFLPVFSFFFLSFSSFFATAFLLISFS
jgi:hypothetical protein